MRRNEIARVQRAMNKASRNVAKPHDKALVLQGPNGERAMEALKDATAQFLSPAQENNELMGVLKFLRFVLNEMHVPKSLKSIPLAMFLEVLDLLDGRKSRIFEQLVVETPRKGDPARDWYARQQLAGIVELQYRMMTTPDYLEAYRLVLTRLDQELKPHGLDVADVFQGKGDKPKAGSERSAELSMGDIRIRDTARRCEGHRMDLNDKTCKGVPGYIRKLYFEQLEMIDTMEAEGRLRLTEREFRMVSYLLLASYDRQDREKSAPRARPADE